VVADEIHISQMIGGTVRGKRIEIGTLFSNTRITASQEVVFLNPMKGSDNHIIIEAGATEDEKNKIANFVGEMKELEAKLSTLQKKFLDKKKQVRQAQESSAQLKEYILQAKKDGRKPSQTHIDRYKKFMEVMAEVKEMQEDLTILEEKIGKDRDEITIIQDAALHAKITNMHSWSTHNKIYYKLIDPPETIEYIPKIGMKAGTLVLKMVGANEYSVEVKYL